MNLTGCKNIVGNGFGEDNNGELITIIDIGNEGKRVEIFDNNRIDYFNEEGKIIFEGMYICDIDELTLSNIYLHYGRLYWNDIEILRYIGALRNKNADSTDLLNLNNFVNGTEIIESYFVHNERSKFYDRNGDLE